MTSSVSTSVDGSLMSSTEGGPPDDVKKKRRLESVGSSSDTDLPAKITGKARKKMRKLEMPPELLHQPNDHRRALAESHFDVISKSLANFEARKNPNYVPIYKQKLYADSPVSEDPYALPDSTPDSRRTFPRKKQAFPEPGCSTSSSGVVATSEAAITPDLPQNKQKRLTPWSPHPGALLKKKQQKKRARKPATSTKPPSPPPSSSPTSPILNETGLSVPGVGFAASPKSGLMTSKSSVNLLHKPAEPISTPVRMPARSLLRASGMSTSALRIRRPLDIDYGEAQSTQQPTSPRKKVVVEKFSGGEKPSTSFVPPLRRHRSSSVGSITKELREEIEADPVAPAVSMTTRSRSVERELSEEMPLPPTRVLRETPERARHQSATQEQSRMKKSASSNNLALLNNPAANVTVRSTLTRTFSAGSLAPRPPPMPRKKTAATKKATPEVITVESSSDGSQPPAASTKPPLPVSPSKTAVSSTLHVESLPPVPPRAPTSSKKTAKKAAPEAITFDSSSSSDGSQPPVASSTSKPPIPVVSPVKTAAPSKPPTPMTSRQKKAVVAPSTTPVKHEQKTVVVAIEDSSGDEFFSTPSSPTKQPAAPEVSSSSSSDVVVFPPPKPEPLTQSSDSSLEVLFQSISNLASCSSSSTSSGSTIPPPPVVQLSSSSESSDAYYSQDSDVVPCSQEIEEKKEPVAEEDPDVVPCSQDSDDVVPCSQESVVVLSSHDESSQPSAVSDDVVFVAPPAPLKGILKTPNSAKKDRRRIDFSNLQVFYFGRVQGFHVIPEHGDVALGMEYTHFNQRDFKVLKTRRQAINMTDAEDSELSEGEDPGFDGFCRRRDFEKDNQERSRMLQENGVAIERQKSAAELLRRSRKQCGCSCRGGVCRPNSCECSRAGVPCQVDRQEADGRYFPCNCVVAQLCGNEHGHLFYDYERVSESRRTTIQRWRDMQKTGIYASPSVKRFDSEEDVDADVVADSQEMITPTREDFLLAPRGQGTPVYPARVERLKHDDLPSTPTSAPAPRPSPMKPPPTTSFFPPSQSLL